jgi:putative flippase GtrA
LNASLRSIIQKSEILRYSIAGISSTMVDWALFYLLAIEFHMHYRLALSLAVGLSAIVNYRINRAFTFHSTSTMVIRQMLLYFALVLLSLLLSLLLMHLLIDVIHLRKMTARVITTLLLAIFNYLMTKWLPFNPLLFKN